MRSFFSRLIYGGSKRLRPHESACFTALTARLPDQAARLLREQVQAIDLVQRSSKDKLVAVYFSDPVPLFPNKEPELRVARIQCLPQAAEVIRADVVCHEGRLSSLEFSKSPEALAKGAFSIPSVEVNEDLLREPSVFPIADETKMPTVNEIKRSLPVSDLMPPASSTELERFLADLPGGSLPADYVVLLRETNGFRAGNWRFHGTKARRIVLPDKTLVLAAEGTEKALCFESEGRSGLLVYDQIDDEVVAIKDGFVSAFLDVAARDHVDTATQ